MVFGMRSKARGLLWQWVAPLHRLVCLSWSRSSHCQNHPSGLGSGMLDSVISGWFPSSRSSLGWSRSSQCQNRPYGPASVTLDSANPGWFPSLWSPLGWSRSSQCRNRPSGPASVTLDSANPGSFPPVESSQGVVAIQPLSEPRTTLRGWGLICCTRSSRLGCPSWLFAAGEGGVGI